MTAVDTNIVVRFLVADDPDQHERAAKLLATTPCFLPDTVVLETVWVLGSAYGYSREQIGRALRGLFGLPNVHVTDFQRMQNVLDWYAEGLDFADALHLSASQAAEAFVTFDQRFITRAAGKGLCRVIELGDSETQ